MLKQDFETVEKKKEYLRLKIAIVTSMYHGDLTEKMRQGCIDTLIASGVKRENVICFDAPGSWEIAVIVKALANTKKFDGIAAFGIILKGDTYHFELIANESARALMNTSLEHELPIAFEILAVYSLDQARKRVEGSANKGIEAANALLRATSTIGRIHSKKSSK